MHDLRSFECDGRLERVDSLHVGSLTRKVSVRHVLSPGEFVSHVRVVKYNSNDRYFVYSDFFPAISAVVE